MMMMMMMMMMIRLWYVHDDFAAVVLTIHRPILDSSKSFPVRDFVRLIYCRRRHHHHIRRLYHPYHLYRIRHLNHIQNRYHLVVVVVVVVAAMNDFVVVVELPDSVVMEISMVLVTAKEIHPYVEVQVLVLILGLVGKCDCCQCHTSRRRLVGNMVDVD